MFNTTRICNFYTTKKESAPQDTLLIDICIDILLDNHEWLISSYSVALGNEQAKNLTSIVRRD